MPDTPFGAESGGSTPGWAERLADNLTSLDCVFSTLVDVQRRNLTLTQEEEERLGIQGAIDPCDLTHQTARSLSRVIEALGELPAFAENGLTALTALRNAIMALDDGNQPALLTPRKGVSLGQDNIGRRTYKAHLIQCVELLEAVEMTNAAARKLVASVFAKAGHKGQAGSPLSASTLFNWQANLDDFGREFVDRTLGEWRSSPAWPPSVADAEAFVRRKAEHPIISFAMAK